jgi:hypothetical protein
MISINERVRRAFNYPESPGPFHSYGDGHKCRMFGGCYVCRTTEQMAALEQDIRDECRTVPGIDFIYRLLRLPFVLALGYILGLTTRSLLNL